MVYPSVHRPSDLSLLELLQHSSEALLKRESRHLTPARDPSLRQTDRAFFSESGVLMASEAFHAAPLSPLKTRDLVALDELFSHDEMRRMEEDILHNLLRRCPEPCWEDTLLEFL
jgi:hypothetical protein